MSFFIGRVLYHEGGGVAAVITFFCHDNELILFAPQSWAKDAKEKSIALHPGLYLAWK